MKNAFTLLLVILFSVSAYSQELAFDVRGSASNSIKKDQLRQASTLKDIRANYPSSWITEYTAVDIKCIQNGVTTQASGMNDTLSHAQRQLLISAEIGADLLFEIFHLYRNPVTGNTELREVQFSYSIIPQSEAVFYGGEEALNAFLKEKAIQKIPKATGQTFDQAIISFTVNEKGSVHAITVEKSSGDSKVDKVLVNALNKMPNWKPAENEEGVKVKQTFQFTVGYPGC